MAKGSTPHPNIAPSPSTWAQNHEFSKSLETTQTGNQGARGFQRGGAAFPLMSTGCPTADQPPLAFPGVCPTITDTNTRRGRTALCRSLLSPFPLPSPLLLLPTNEDAGFPGFPISHPPAPSCLPPEPAQTPFPPPALPPSIPMCSTAHLVPVVVGPFRGRPGGFS